MFGSQLLCKISRDEIVEYRDKIFDEFSAVTSNRGLFVIKQVFKMGLEVSAVFTDHSEGIKALSEKSHERNKFLMPEELFDLVAACKTTRAKFYLPALIFLSAEHGASKQEALSLKWSDINFDFDAHGIITMFRTKNNKERTEYLMPRTKKALLDWKSHLDFMRTKKKMSCFDNTFVFCRLDGTRIKEFKTAWKTARIAAGLDGFHFHDLRHTFCSNLILSGTGIKETKDMIGHSDLSMTDRYSHLTLLHKKGCQDRLAKHYEKGEKN